MPDPISIITLCCIGVMCLVSLGRALKEELRESHEKRFAGYTRRPFSPLSTDPTTLKLCARLFGLLREHAKDPLVKTQSPVRDPFASSAATSGKEVLVVGDTVHFQRLHSSVLDYGMWVYLQTEDLSIMVLCCDTETRDAYLRHLEDPKQRFELTEIWSH
jgi:hypothetical protein